MAIFHSYVTIYQRLQRKNQAGYVSGTFQMSDIKSDADGICPFDKGSSAIASDGSGRCEWHPKFTVTISLQTARASFLGTSRMVFHHPLVSVCFRLHLSEKRGIAQLLPLNGAKNDKSTAAWQFGPVGCFFSHSIETYIMPADS